MTWIKMRTSLETDGRVRIMCGHLSAKCPHVIGQLFRFWSLGDKHATDEGVLYGWTPEAVDEYLGEPGFCDALPGDWIDLNGPWVKLPEYREHNGTTTKRRLAEAKRKGRERRKTSASNADKCPQNVPNVSDESRTPSSLLYSSLNSSDCTDPKEEVRPLADLPERDIAPAKVEFFLPEQLDTPACRAALATLLAFRLRIGMPVDAMAWEATCAELHSEGATPERFCEAVSYTVQSRFTKKLLGPRFERRAQQARGKAKTIAEQNYEDHVERYGEP